MRDEGRQTDIHSSISITMTPLRMLEPATILVVDDNDQLRGLCLSWLAESGFRVLEAGNGLEALLITVEHKGAVDLVITDLSMPQMSGADLGRVLEEMWPGMNMLYISGSPRETVSKELPTDCAFLPKPFARDALVNAARCLVERNQEDLIRA